MVNLSELLEFANPGSGSREMKTTVRIIGVAGLALLFVTCNLFGPQPIYETTTVGIAVDTNGPVSAVLSVGGSGSSAARSLASSAPLLAISDSPDPANIATMTVTVSGEDRFGIPQIELTSADLVNTAGVWSVTLDDLPIGPALTFAVVALDAAGDQLYDGTTTTTLGAAGETVSIVLQPSNRGTTVFFPVIRAITRPAEIIESTVADIDFDLGGSSDETLDVVIADGGGGTFTPAATSLAVGASGEGTLGVDFAAGAVVGNYTHTVTVTNSQGNSVASGFDTTIVYETGSVEIQIGIAPSVFGFSAQRIGDNVIWSATITDDGPASELVIDWQFVQATGASALVFGVPSDNPTVLFPYDETASGDIILTVTDGNGSGLSTTVTFAMPAGLFPDNVVVDTGGGTPPGNFAYVSAASGNDTNPGTITAPVATIQRATNIVAGTGADGTIFVEGGTYPISSSLTIVDGVSISGSFDSSFTVQDIDLHPTTISDTRTSGGDALNSITAMVVPASVGRETEIRGLVVNAAGNTSQRPNYTTAMSVQGSPTIAGNVLFGGWSNNETSGIVTGGSAAPLIADNVIQGGYTLGPYSYGIKLFASGSHLVELNTIEGGGSGGNVRGIQISFGGGHQVIRNNLITSGSGSDEAGIAIGTGTADILNNTIYGETRGIRIVASTVRIENNIIWSGATTIYEQQNADPSTVLNNTFVTGTNFIYNHEASSLITDIATLESTLNADNTVASGNVKVDPAFASFTGPDGDVLTLLDNDWQLTAASPAAVRSGALDLSGTDGFDDDREGTTRTPGWSMGALEY